MFGQTEIEARRNLRAQKQPGHSLKRRGAPRGRRPLFRRTKESGIPLFRAPILNFRSALGSPVQAANGKLPSEQNRGLPIDFVKQNSSSRKSAEISAISRAVPGGRSILSFPFRAHRTAPVLAEALPYNITMICVFRQVFCSHLSKSRLFRGRNGLPTRFFVLSSWCRSQIAIAWIRGQLPPAYGNRTRSGEPMLRP